MTRKTGPKVVRMPGLAQKDLAEVVAQCQATPWEEGGRELADHIYQRLASNIQRIGRRYALADGQEFIDELTSDVGARFQRMIKSCRDPQKFEHLFNVATKRAALSLQRQRKVRREHKASWTGLSADDIRRQYPALRTSAFADDIPNTREIQIRQCIERMASEGARSARQAMVIQLRYVECLTRAEIATKLDVSTKTVQRDEQAAKERLLELMQALGS